MRIALSRQDANSFADRVDHDVIAAAAGEGVPREGGNTLRLSGELTKETPGF
jgi:hypothetical protein